MNKSSVLNGLLFIIIFACVGGFLLAQEKEEKKTIVPGWKWVVVKNLERVKSDNAQFVYGDTCGIRKGGVLKVLGTDKDLYLVHYSIKGSAYGTQCPEGVLFFIHKDTFSRMREDYNRVQRAEERDRALVRRLSQ